MKENFNMAIVLLLICIFLLIKKAGFHRLNGFLLYFIILAMNSLQQTLGKINIIDINYMVLFVCVGFLIPLILKNQKIMELISLVSIVQSVYIILGMKFGIFDFFSGNILRVSGFFNHPIHLYVQSLICMMLILPAAVLNNKKLYIVGAICSLLCIQLTWFRGVNIAIIISILLFMKNIQNRKHKIMILVLSSLLFCITMVMRNLGRENLNSTSRSTYGHVYVVKKGINILRENPIVGVGMGNLEIPVTSMLGKKIKNECLTEPKNLFLFFACELGVIGIFMIGLIIKNIRDIFLKINNTYISYGIYCSWISLAVVGFFDTPFGPVNRYVGNLMFGLMMGMTVNLLEIRKNDNGIADIKKIVD